MPAGDVNHATTHEETALPRGPFSFPGRPVTTSLKVAEYFGKRHDNVIQSIQTLDCSDEFGALNFQETSYVDKSNRQKPMYEMTRDGWAFLVMGFTGKKAARSKPKLRTFAHFLRARKNRVAGRLQGATHAREHPCFRVSVARLAIRGGGQ
ncbi:hypothetical protein DESC_810088 [Desulfosarcina cetonica]|uniref:Rha family transcriptional regulator n=1 Tax=Desulfosarcina cetonica TaxID=90730 RepID=UPI0006D1E37B|nr:Rha family transcriptional regulator [Desulfosarcina cetonica]VTR70517.1 hypothetical protein DESC_810088 [Desulfosarcina cetonica]